MEIKQALTRIVSLREALNNNGQKQISNNAKK